MPMGCSTHHARSLTAKAGRQVARLDPRPPKDFKHERRGVAHLKVASKSGKVRYVPLHLAANGLVNAGLD